MPGVDNVKDVQLAGGRQIDLMATFARSPPVHQWTSSPLTSRLAYLPQWMATGTSFSPLTTSPNGLRLYPCAMQRHKGACVHYTAPSSAASACLASCIATREATLRVSWWQSSARLRVLTKLMLAAYRMTPHSVTGISPNMAMMRREVLLPTSLIVQPPEEPVAVTTSFAADFRQNMRTRMRLVALRKLKRTTSTNTSRDLRSH